MAEQKRKKNMSPEAREKLSRLAKERHARGEFGGREFGKLGGRPKKDRAAARVAAAAQDDSQARAIISVFKDAIQPDQPMSIRIKAAEAWLGIEREEAKIVLQEADADATQRSRDELISILGKKLTAGPTAQILRRQLEPETGIVDAEVVIEGQVVEEPESDAA